LDTSLSFNARKALSVQLGDAAGEEIADLIRQMARRIEELERSKVNVTPVAPDNSPVISLG